MGLLRKPLVWIFATAIFVTCPLGYFALHPSYLAEISVVPNANSLAAIPCNFSSVRVYNGVAQFEFNAEVANPSTQKVKLSIQPAMVKESFDQPIISVNDGIARGAVQLGSEEYPLNRYTSYWFRLEDSGNSQLLSSGSIMVNATEITGGSSKIILICGLLASVFQIVQGIVAMIVSRRTEGSK
jgi:hypothetical protein